VHGLMRTKRGYKGAITKLLRYLIYILMFDLWRTLLCLGLGIKVSRVSFNMLLRLKNRMNKYSRYYNFF